MQALPSKRNSRTLEVPVAKIPEDVGPPRFEIAEALRKELVMAKAASRPAPVSEAESSVIRRKSARDVPMWRI